MTIYLDMDGTFYNLYGIDGWLDELLTESKNIFTKGNSLYKIEDLQKTFENVSSKYKLGIITWTPKECRKTYVGNTAKQKYKWLRENDLMKYFSKIVMVEYGKEKYKYMEENDILIDDDMKNITTAKENNRKAIHTNGTDLIKILETI